jgi:hypothetical protein
MSDDMDDAKLAAFVADATKFSAMFASFATVGVELKKLLSLKNAERELESRLSLLKKREADVTASVAAAADTQRKAEIAADATRRSAEEWAVALRSQSQSLASDKAAAAEKTVIDARLQAKALVDQAREMGAKTLDEAKYKAAAEEGRVATAKAELETLSAQLADRQKHLDALATHASEFARKVGR